MALALLAGLFVPVEAAPDTDRAKQRERVTSDDTWQAVAQEPAHDDSVPEGDRKELLGSAWPSSDDQAWALVGDATGLHVLVAGAADGYAWEQVATLSEVGFDTDQWIGNGCTTESGQRLVVTYAPRTFTNDPVLNERGGFVATVDLTTGQVTKLPVTSTLAYFSPGCGHGEAAVITQGGEDLDRTRLVHVDTATGTLGKSIEVPGQLTSAVPTTAGIVGADSGALVTVADDGSRRVLAPSRGVPFRLTATDSGLVFMDAEKGQAAVKRLDVSAPKSARNRVETLAEGRLDQVGVMGASRKAVITGEPRSLPRRLPSDVLVAKGAAVDAVPSSLGQLLVEGRQRRAAGDEVLDPAAGVFDVTARSSRTNREIEFTVATTVQDADAPTPSPSLTSPGVSVQAEGSPTNPVEEERTCSVPRNDPRNQVMQPKPRQVEWAVDQAVTGSLTVQRPANWKNLGMPTYRPQGPGGLFDAPQLVGGGRIPAQVMLGIIAQESNMWQATRLAVPGVTANPLIGNYYGRAVYDDDGSDDWWVNFAKADCGYGLTQRTDGMRLAGHGRKDEVLLPYQTQRAVALDFAANVAAGVQTLAEKWNTTRNAGLVLNNGDSSRIENWFFAVWAYNSGFHEESSGGQPWGVGWLNNPANPRYPANRTPFLDRSMADAAIPQQWPYPEKVMGFAAYPIEALEAPNAMVAGYRAAWWGGGSSVGEENRRKVKPPIHQFCDETNDCSPGAKIKPTHPDVINEPAGPCAHRDSGGKYDLKCWYHAPTTWKPNCDFSCGNELLRFDPGYAYQADGNAYPPSCSRTGLPSSAYVVDNLPAGTQAPRPDCGPVQSSGSFALQFNGGPHGYSSKVDFHQIGAGYGAHFWMAHTRRDTAANEAMHVTGTWTLNRRLNGWARVMVHIPDHGAHTQEATYEVRRGQGLDPKRRVVQQRTYANKWVSLGALQFNGVPSVSLSTKTAKGDGNEDVAWDAVAFEVLPGKPRHMVVALGDSFSSGEGGSAAGGVDYYRETDNNGRNPKDRNRENIYRNACHRSPFTWSRGASFSDSLRSVGQRADSWDRSMDYHLLACSGAETENLLPTRSHLLPGELMPVNEFGDSNGGMYREPSQLDKGYLDEHTTLVTLSIGGNDAGFAPVIEQCVRAEGPCYDSVLEGDTEPMRTAVVARIRTKVNPSIVTTLQAIQRRAPNAEILLMGYPRLFEPPTSDDDMLCDPRLTRLGGDEVRWMNEVAVVLAEEMAGAAATARQAGVDVEFVDPRASFEGRGVCGDPAALHSVVLQLTDGDTSGLTLPLPGSDAEVSLSAQSFHPTTDGYSIYAGDMTAALRRIGM